MFQFNIVNKNCLKYKQRLNLIKKCFNVKKEFEREWEFNFITQVVLMTIPCGLIFGLYLNVFDGDDWSLF